jgi:hypothetical protein
MKSQGVVGGGVSRQEVLGRGSHCNKEKYYDINLEGG